MAQYEHSSYLSQNDHSEYDAKYSTVVEAPNTGICRCVACWDEIAIAKGHKLPSQNHHKHNRDTKK